MLYITIITDFNNFIDSYISKTFIMVIRKLQIILQMAVYPDVERPRGVGESRIEGIWTRDLATARQAEENRVSTK